MRTLLAPGSGIKSLSTPVGHGLLVGLLLVCLSAECPAAEGDPFPPAGVDHPIITSTDVRVELDCGINADVTFAGKVSMSHSDPYWDAEQNLVADLTVLALSLRGAPPHDDMLITLFRLYGPSVGTATSLNGEGFPATSHLDIYFRLTTSCGTFVNRDPHPMDSNPTISAFPPDIGEAYLGSLALLYKVGGDTSDVDGVDLVSTGRLETNQHTITNVVPLLSSVGWVLLLATFLLIGSYRGWKVARSRRAQEPSAE